MTREFEKVESVPYEALFHPVISFFQINLDSHYSTLTFLFRHRVDQLLHNYGIINTFSTRNKSRLERRHNVCKKRTNSCHNDLSNHLIDGIAKADRAIVSKGLRVVAFWN